MHKFMILTDSDGNPRGFPASELFHLEDTYPYIIRKYYKDSVFWQLSFGDTTTAKLITQSMEMLAAWKPDIIIVQSGINDCTPEAFSDFEKELMGKWAWPGVSYLKKHVNDPAWIKWRQVYRVSMRKYRHIIQQFQQSFPASKIFWLEISAGNKYEEKCPGVNQRMAAYNRILKEVYGEDVIPVQEEMLRVDGFNAIDHVHWNIRAHRAAADILIKRINSSLGVVHA